ncbi:C-type lectin domain family 2 member E-like [Grus japonensis]|uniref:C-type lectin domain family 2 member E-like n=1 Tax=Grus japonensis TaxID=30415 RepID=A0ABC9XUU9_GRUJA
MAEAVPDAGFSLKCIKDKKVPIAVTVVIAALLLTIIALAGKWLRMEVPTIEVFSFPGENPQVCLGEEIGYGDKCFYFVEAEADWNRSQIFCLSLGAHLATIDSRGDLHFLLRYAANRDFWFGLQRENTGPWKWFNGSLFNNLFEVRGNGQCAYVNVEGISSDWCSQMKYFVCSHLQKHPSRILKDSEILLNFTSDSPSWQRRSNTSCC